jgi:hypothetical protein
MRGELVVAAVLGLCMVLVSGGMTKPFSDDVLLATHEYGLNDLSGFSMGGLSADGSAPGLGGDMGDMNSYDDSQGEDSDDGDDEQASVPAVPVLGDESSLGSMLGLGGMRKKAGKRGGKKSGGGGGNAPTNAMVAGMSQAMVKMIQLRQFMKAQMQAQQAMQMQQMRMRMMGIMASNREMKEQVFQFRRHMPGGCDCCQSCPPPPAFPAAAFQQGGF